MDRLRLSWRRWSVARLTGLCSCSRLAMARASLLRDTSRPGRLGVSLSDSSSVSLQRLNSLLTSDAMLETLLAAPSSRPLSSPRP